MLSYIIESMDAIISLGTVAVELNFKRPLMSEEDVIIIKGGRHILQVTS
jgi:DNA mismatch repair ATPase MutS